MLLGLKHWSLKRWAGFGIGLLLLALGIWFKYQPEFVAQLVSYVKNMDADTRSSWNDWSTIIANGFSILGVLLTFGSGLIGLLFPRAKADPLPSLSDEMTEQSLPLDDVKSYYYQYLQAQCQRYDLGSFRDSQSLSEVGAIQVQLSQMYVDLMAHEVRPKSEKADEQGRLVNSSRLLLSWLEDDALKRFIVRGNVGSGKSSFINYLCHGLLQSHQGKAIDPPIPDHWQRRPVVRILLRSMGGKIDPTQTYQADREDSGLWRFIQGELSQQLAEDTSIDDQVWQAFKKQFQAGGVLILDGLDEVSDSGEQPEQQSRRQWLLCAIQSFARQPAAQHINIVITSRNHAYGGDDVLAGFRLLQLDPLTYAGRYAVFTRHWYDQVVATIDEQEHGKQEAEDLLQQIERRPALQHLIETPLLMTLLLVLNKASVSLPESRAELYESAVALLLDRWHKQLLGYASSLSAEEQQALGLLKQDSRLLLGAMKSLAYQTYKTHQSEAGRALNETIVFDTAAVEQALKNALQHDSRFGFEDQDACHYFLRYRSQLLMAAGEGLSFAHKSFHEYLAAAYIVENQLNSEEYLDGLIRDVGKRDHWREVFLFGMNLNKGKARDVLKALRLYISSSYPNNWDDDKWQAHLEHFNCYSEAALENRLESYVSQSAREQPDIAEVYQDLQNYCRMLWEHPDLSIPNKALLGRIWGRCGDTRPGITWKRGASGAIRYQSLAKRNFPIPDFDWCCIETGVFQMGSPDDDEAAFADEKPVHSVRFDKPVYLTRSPVTNAQYQSFIDAGGYDDDAVWAALPKAAQRWREGHNDGMDLLETFPEKHREAYRQHLLNDQERQYPRYWLDGRWNLPNHPVVGVSWYEALAYCEWLHQQRDSTLPAELLERDGRVRLPFEDEWEYAARGCANYRYANGEETLHAMDANYEDTQLKRTTAPGVFSASKAFELYDLSGNVWEWTGSRWGSDFSNTAFPYEDYDLGRLQQQDDSVLDYKMMRGGSWGNTSDFLRCAIRYGYLPNYRDFDVGFRLFC